MHRALSSVLRPTCRVQRVAGWTRRSEGRARHCGSPDCARSSLVASLSHLGLGAGCGGDSLHTDLGPYPRSARSHLTIHPAVSVGGERGATRPEVSHTLGVIGLQSLGEHITALFSHTPRGCKDTASSQPPPSSESGHVGGSEGTQGQGRSASQPSGLPEIRVTTPGARPCFLTQNIRPGSGGAGWTGAAAPTAAPTADHGQRDAAPLPEPLCSLGGLPRTRHTLSSGRIMVAEACPGG